MEGGRVEVRLRIGSTLAVLVRRNFPGGGRISTSMPTHVDVLNAPSRRVTYEPHRQCSGPGPRCVANCIKYREPGGRTRWLSYYLGRQLGPRREVTPSAHGK